LQALQSVTGALESTRPPGSQWLGCLDPGCLIPIALQELGPHIGKGFHS
jgi:hypothetical protein